MFDSLFDIIKPVFELIGIFFEYLYGMILSNIVYGIGELMERSERRKGKRKQDK